MDHYQLSLRNCFAAYSIDRVSDKRRDAAWIGERLKNASTRFVPVWQSKNLFTDGEVMRPVLLSSGDLEALSLTTEPIVFLGQENGTTYFAIDLTFQEPSPPSNLTALGQFRDLRGVGALLDLREGTLLAYAKAITYWHGRHRFCGDCGSPTVSTEGGHMRVCTNDACKQQVFPRTDPAIIVLVTSGEHCLLGRQAVWPKKMYSTIAGFVEPGESLEGAVVREVMEETDIRVDGVSYHSSQPWPFPTSLMLGFTAQGASREIRLRDKELEDARWFTRKEIETALRDGTLKLPSNVSIAYRLIEGWFDAEEADRLKRVLHSLV